LRERRVARQAKRVLISGALALTLFCTAAYAHELPDAIPPQPLADALEAFATASGFQLVYRADLAAGSISKGSDAHVPALDALKQLLRGTGLTFNFVNDHTIAIIKAPPDSSKPPARPLNQPPSDDRNAEGKPKPKEGLLARLAALFQGCRSAQAGAGCDGRPGAEAEQVRADAPMAEIIVTGTRQGGMQAAESPVPIQIISGDALQAAAAGPDLMSTLAQLIPSMTMQAYGVDMAAQTLQAKLRGLNPNHVLVLIDGKRRHTTANIAVAAGSAYQGGAGVDLNFIPIDAIDHIEVLTEGAAAQYGTDAIAGVINIITKKAYRGGRIAGMYGSYDGGGGETGDLSGNLGFEPSSAGYLNVTGEVRGRGRSNQGGIDERVINPTNLSTYPGSNMPRVPGYPYITMIEGDAQIHTALASIKAGWEMASGTELYAFATYGDKRAASYENYRLPTKLHYTDPVTGITSYPYPLGFNPQEATREQDFSLTGGAKGAASGWHWDLSTVYGRDRLELYTRDSANAGIYNSTGRATPSTYFDGTLQMTQWTTTIDVDRDFDAGLAAPLNTAFGMEYRRETYRIGAGIPVSYELGGGQSYPGFSPADAGSNDRQNVAAYVDLSGKPVDRLGLDAAGRFEHYSDFGSATVFKLAGRWDASPAFAIRGTVSDGFRAPTMAEEFYSSTTVTPTTAYVQMPPNSAGGKLLGLGNGLQPEKSVNLSLGIVYRPIASMSMSLDLYQISISSRIVGSGHLVGSSGGVVVAPNIIDAIVANGNQLDPDVMAKGVTGINVFTNGIDTRTRGADLTLALPVDWGLGRLNYSIGATYNDTAVTRVRATPPELGSTPLFDATAISDLTTANPKYIVNLGALCQFGNVTFNLVEKIYGPSSEYENDDGDNPTGLLQYFRTRMGVTPITNVDLSYQWTPRLKLTIGANNLFNRFPPTLNAALLAHVNSFDYGDNLGVQHYPSFSPFGINGGYYFARASLQF
jgi:iron complex outermembrane receptor protein